MKYALLRPNCNFSIGVYKDKLKDFTLTKEEYKDVDTYNDDVDMYTVTYIELDKVSDFYKLNRALDCELVVSNYYNTPLSYNTVKCPTITVYDDYLE